MKFSASVFLLAVLTVTIVIIDCEENENNIDCTARAVKELGKYIWKRAIVFEDASELSVYYNLENNQTIHDMMPRPWYHPGQSLRLPFIGQPCVCADLQCGCCAGIKINQFNVDSKACANLTYDPSMFALNLDVSVNDRNILHQSLSAKNPPPLCIPVPIAGIPGIDFCIRLFDIFIQDHRNLHVCVDFETRIASAPVLVLHFDCVKMGADGVSLEKPTQGDTQQAIIPGEFPDTEDTVVPPQSGIDTYDEVTEIKKDFTTSSPLIAVQHISESRNESI